MDRKPVLIAIIVVILAIAAACVCWSMSGSFANGAYYVQVDNEKVHELHSQGGVIDPTGGMSWEYTLEGRNADGDVREISFGTERQLRDGAYLKLSLVPIRGVVAWGEVQLDEMPSSVRSAFE